MKYNINILFSIPRKYINILYSLNTISRSTPNNTDTYRLVFEKHYYNNDNAYSINGKTFSKNSVFSRDLTYPIYDQSEMLSSFYSRILINVFTQTPINEPNVKFSYISSYLSTTINAGNIEFSINSYNPIAVYKNLNINTVVDRYNQFDSMIKTHYGRIECIKQLNLSIADTKEYIDRINTNNSHSNIVDLNLELKRMGKCYINLVKDFNTMSEQITVIKQLFTTDTSTLTNRIKFETLITFNFLFKNLKDMNVDILLNIENIKGVLENVKLLSNYKNRYNHILSVDQAEKNDNLYSEFIASIDNYNSIVEIMKSDIYGKNLVSSDITHVYQMFIEKINIIKLKLNRINLVDSLGDMKIEKNKVIQYLTNDIFQCEQYYQLLKNKLISNNKTPDSSKYDNSYKNRINEFIEKIRKTQEINPPSSEDMLKSVRENEFYSKYQHQFTDRNMVEMESALNELKQYPTDTFKSKLVDAIHKLNVIDLLNGIYKCSDDKISDRCINSYLNSIIPAKIDAIDKQSNEQSNELALKDSENYIILMNSCSSFLSSIGPRNNVIKYIQANVWIVLGLDDVLLQYRCNSDVKTELDIRSRSIVKHLYSKFNKGNAVMPSDVYTKLNEFIEKVNRSRNKYIPMDIHSILSNITTCDIPSNNDNTRLGISDKSNIPSIYIDRMSKVLAPWINKDAVVRAHKSIGEYMKYENPIIFTFTRIYSHVNCVDMYRIIQILDSILKSITVNDIPDTILENNAPMLSPEDKYNYFLSSFKSYISDIHALYASSENMKKRIEVFNKVANVLTLEDVDKLVSYTTTYTPAIKGWLNPAHITMLIDTNHTNLVDEYIGYDDDIMLDEFTSVEYLNRVTKDKIEKTKLKTKLSKHNSNLTTRIDRMFTTSRNIKYIISGDNYILGKSTIDKFNSIFNYLIPDTTISNTPAITESTLFLRGNSENTPVRYFKDNTIDILDVNKFTTWCVGVVNDRVIVFDLINGKLYKLCGTDTPPGQPTTPLYSDAIARLRYYSVVDKTVKEWKLEDIYGYVNYTITTDNKLKLRTIRFNGNIYRAFNGIIIDIGDTRYIPMINNRLLPIESNYIKGYMTSIIDIINYLSVTQNATLQHFYSMLVMIHHMLNQIETLVCNISDSEYIQYISNYNHKCLEFISTQLNQSDMVITDDYRSLKHIPIGFRDLLRGFTYTDIKAGILKKAITNSLCFNISDAMDNHLNMKMSMDEFILSRDRIKELYLQKTKYYTHIKNYISQYTTINTYKSLNVISNVSEVAGNRGVYYITLRKRAST